MPNGASFRFSGRPLTPATCRRTLRPASSGSCSDCRRSAAQNHSRRCSTATLNKTTSSRTDTGAVVVDVAPYFGHPEIDLALVDYFHPVPDDVFDAYQDIMPIDPGFGRRRELWRIFAYLAVITVDGGSPFGRAFLTRLADAVDLYR